MERKQIVKALECCFGNSTCAECPYNDWVGCHRQMMKNAIALIKELTEENERLRAENEALAISEVKECEISQMLVYRIRNKHPAVMAVISDTVRKMQDRFNEVFGGVDATQALLRRTFDHIVKEMVEEMQ